MARAAPDSTDPGDVGWSHMEPTAGREPLPRMASLKPRSESPRAMQASQEVTIYKGERHTEEDYYLPEFGLQLY